MSIGACVVLRTGGPGRWRDVPTLTSEELVWNSRTPNPTWTRNCGTKTGLQTGRVSPALSKDCGFLSHCLDQLLPPLSLQVFTALFISSDLISLLCTSPSSVPPLPTIPFIQCSFFLQPVHSIWWSRHHLQMLGHVWTSPTFCPTPDYDRELPLQPLVSFLASIWCQNNPFWASWL